jgi:hypothetical protein
MGTNTRDLHSTDKAEGGGNKPLKKKKEEEPEDVKFSSLKVTKQIKLRHEGLLIEIAKEIELNKKFIGNALTEAERQKNKDEIHYLKKSHLREVRIREANALKEFKKSKAGLLEQLVGGGQRKAKAVDMSLGSESTQFVAESEQNKRVLERLVGQA